MENNTPPKPGVDARLADLGTRLERIELKLDDHLERVSKLEVGLETVRGFVNYGVAIFLGIIGFLGIALYNLLFPSH